MHLLEVFKKVNSKRPIIGFAVVGAISTAIDFIVLNILAKGFQVEYHVAVGVAFMAGLINGYFLNSRLVFNTEHSWKRYFKYFITSLGGFLWTELIINQLIEQAHMSSLNEAKLIAAFVVLFWNYTLSKLWAFK